MGGDGRGRTLLTRAQWCFAIAAAILLLMAPALWNGFALLEHDTGGYLARPFEGYLVPSRPAAYGLLLAATWRLAFWPALLAQAGATVWILMLALRVYGQGRPWTLMAVAAALSLTTTLALIASTLLTDIFAGLAVLALHLLVFRGDGLSRRERIALTLFAAFCAATHNATLALIVALVLAGCAALAVRRAAVPAQGLRRGALAAGLGLIAMIGANVATCREAWTPGSYGIVFGRLLQDGLVHRYLDEHCPDPALRLCAYRRELPRDADLFLWNSRIFDTLGRFNGLNVEMRTIVLGSLREHPWLNAGAAMTATARQLVSVASGEGILTIIWHTYGIMERYTPAIVPAMKAARQQHGEWHFDAINRLHVPVALLSIVSIALVIGAAAWRGRFDDFDRLAATVGAALLINAAICGGLSNPHDRYGARVTWLATLTVVMLLPARIRRAAGEKMAMPAGA
ncbi:MAG TPA: hypothetical protein VHA55_13155 [Pseudorhodoplanes sp.]|jgi:hypothetical protein|nr:hypothetical protein [Pseudorhodoplanes sp.]